LTETHPPSPVFVHPIEGTFARILDYYGIQWQYEPRTFALEWDNNGAIREAFTPDFYLPEQDLYIELTTIRPQLVRHKNRKLRRMKELYPEINIKLLKRGDLRDMMIRYGLTEEADQLLGTDAQHNGAPPAAA
jgi:hypoxanthine phosphoribosyltransferase